MLAALTLAVLSVLAAPAGAAPAPGSGDVSRLQAASGTWNRFRIVTGRSQYVVTSLRVDPEGVVLAPRRRSALIVTADPDSGGTKRIAWSEIERIEGARSRAFHGAVVGAIAGGLIGLGAKQAFQNDLHDASGVAIVAIPIGAALGGIIGAVAGSTNGWHRLYP